MRKGFTFGYKKTFESIQISPGPGDYGKTVEHDSFEKPTFSMNLSKAPRFKLDRDILKKPGPGAYDPHEISSKIRLPIIGKSGRDPRCFLTSKGIPGPGNYNLPSPFGRPKYNKPPKKSQLDSISQTSLNKPIVTTPGPGSYSINESFYRSNHSIKISSQGTGKFRVASFLKDNGFPGPGKYPFKNQKSGPKFTFGQKNEVKGKPNLWPGPDTYNVNLLNTSASGRKFFRNYNFSYPKAEKTKSEIYERRFFPGPGAYETNKESPLLRENGVIFNTAIRPLYNKSGSLTPGPGSYVSLPSLVKDKHKGYSLSTSIKNKKWQRRFKPRDSYDSIEEQEKKKKIEKRTEFLNNLKLNLSKNKAQYGTPKYAKSPKQFTEAVSVLRRTNSESELKATKFESNHLLGRGISFLKMPSQPKYPPTKSFSIGKSVRKLEYLDPGNVNPDIVRSPGPAGYFVERKLDKKAVKIATSKRDDKYLVLNINPGAGSYSVDSSSFLKRPKKKKKLNPNLMSLLKRIEMKVHPEKSESHSSKLKNNANRKSKKKDYAVVVKG